MPEFSDIFFTCDFWRKWMFKITELKNKLILTAIYGVILLVFWAFGIPCFFLYFLGVRCPGCGMSHALFAILRLDFAEAFSCHPMIFSLPMLYGYFLIDFKSLKQKWLHIIILAVIGIGFLVNWLVRIC